MRQRQARVLTALTMAGVLMLAGVVTATPSFANGNCATHFQGRGVGTPADPYLVSDEVDLNEVRYCASSSFRQVADIDLANPWTPIDDIYNSHGPFTGYYYDGAGYAITGLNVTSGGDNVGLFATADAATFSNMNISGTISGRDNVGALVGGTSGVSFNNCVITASVQGVTNVGGLAGEMLFSSASGSKVSGTVRGNLKVGGVAGRTTDIGLNLAASDMNVTGDSQVGGLIGEMYDGDLTSSYSTGDVSGGQYVGGIVGRMSHLVSDIEDVYSRGTIVGTAAGWAGTIFGDDPLDPWGNTIARAYGTGRVVGPNSGGVGGESRISQYLSQTFWDTQTTLKLNAFGSGSTPGATGLDTAAMTSLDTYQSAGWSISSTWSASGTYTWGICSQVNDGYPYLQSFYSSDPCAIQDPTQFPQVSLQQFAVPAGTTVGQCALLAPPEVDWAALSTLRAQGWSLGYAEWPNRHTGGWVCSRQPYWTGRTWAFLS